MRTAPRSVIILSRCAWTLYNFRLREAGVEFRTVPVSQHGIAPLSDLHLLYSLVCLFRREALLHNAWRS